ncbi:MAG: DUF3500 domain-containing protein, partial [Phaeodactylibacter sp.]|nr:DUF3500 domain-containing protein [Phaeodactylibacter sp.]
MKKNSLWTSKLQSALLFLSAFGVIGLFFAGNNPAKDVEMAKASAKSAFAEPAAPVANQAITLVPPPDLDIAQLVSDATDFYNALSSSQQSTLQQDYTTTLARKWSNLPCGSGCRNGIQLGSLTADQLALAQQVIADVLGTTATNGYQEYSDITLSEDALVAAGASSTQYNSGLRWLAFLNA